MDHIAKEQEIIQRLEATNYALYDGNRAAALDGLHMRLRAFADYSAQVCRQQFALPILYKTLERDELQAEVTRIDKARRAAQNNAIASLSMLNRLCRALELEPFADVDTGDRHAVAEFVGEYVRQLYAHGIGRA